MLTTELGMVTPVSPVQYSNASAAMLFTVLGIVLTLNPINNTSVAFSMMALQLSRESYVEFPASIVTLLNPLQPEKAQPWMFVTLAGMEMEISPLFEKALEPMLVTLLGIVVPLQPRISVFVAVSMTALQLSRESYVVLSSSTVMVIRLVQLLKAMLSTLATVSPMTTVSRVDTPFNHVPTVGQCRVADTRPDPLKALDAIVVTLLGISMEVKPVQP